MCTNSLSHVHGQRERYNARSEYDSIGIQTRTHSTPVLQGLTGSRRRGSSPAWRRGTSAHSAAPSTTRHDDPGPEPDHAHQQQQHTRQSITPAGATRSNTQATLSLSPFRHHNSTAQHRSPPQPSFTAPHTRPYIRVQLAEVLDTPGRDHATEVDLQVGRQHRHRQQLQHRRAVLVQPARAQ